jgi:Tol biopolymer transport system component
VPDYDWWVVPVEGGKPVRVGVSNAFRKAGFTALPFPLPRAWIGAGNRILFSAAIGDGPTNLWQLSISSGDWQLIGEPERLTSGTGEQWPSASSTGRLAFMNVQNDNDIGSVSLNPNGGKAAGPLQSVVTGIALDGYPTISADGSKMVYVSRRSGNPDVWLRNFKTGEDRQVTVSRDNESRAAISPDGARIAFTRSSQPQKIDLYVADTTGGNAERLLLDGIGNMMDWLPDGKRILYYTRPPLRWMTLEPNSGETSEIRIESPEYPVHDLRFAPDQRWVSFKIYRDARRMGPMYIAHIDGNKVAAQQEWIPIADPLWNGRNWWSPDGRSLYFLSLRDGFWCIWVQRLDGATKKPIGEPHALMHLHGQQRFNHNFMGYGLAPDKLYVTFFQVRSNVWIADPL